MNLQALELALVGAAAGGFGALLGVGGGVILVPALSLVAGLAFRHAVAASLVCMVATSVAGSIVHLGRNRIELSLGLELQFFTVLGAVGAGVVAGFIPAGPLVLVFAGLLAYTAWQMLPRRTRPAPAGSPTVAAPRAAVAGATVGAGLLSGLLGVGGGLVNTPVLHLMLGVPFERAAATSTYIIGTTAAASALIYFARGDVIVGATAPAMLGTLAGSALAAVFGRRLNQVFVRYLFVALLVYVAFQMVLRGLAQL